MSLCHLFLLSFSLRRLLIPSYLTMSERHCDIHGTYHPERLGISITTPRLSLIYVRRLQPELSMRSRSLTLEDLYGTQL